MKKRPAISELIHEIHAAQSDGRGEFDAGLFPSWRENRTFFYSRPDQNIFCSLSVAFVLMHLEEDLEERERRVCQEIRENVVAALPKFESLKGKDTYNFWKTRPSKHFPKGYFMHRFRHFQLPDDVDDTALAFSVMRAPEAQISALKEKLKLHCAPDSKVYDTWFGKDMPKENDFCALCNLMCLLLGASEVLNAYDLATLAFINEGISSNSFLSEPFWLSRNYGNTALIVYHFARLWAMHRPAQLETGRKYLLSRQTELLASAQTLWAKMLLQIGFMKLGGEPHGAFDEMQPFQQEAKPYFFVASLFAPLGKKWTNALAEKEWTWINWVCPALSLALKVEYEIWRKRSLQKQLP
ncbi:hypothetical protein LAG90_09380 [Marinilongibacter aquaticus]|uniref:hypothetical protein n=1 Tax=Marinilongibacter aquaticus TaxID=2975157 RepID=UPI0021BDD74A|nr:hypothetical protein [Marinilongibacter aquaticus]UBM60845.1 hypothetical protein LAG90_09380 [Marinilongibacter aquaticus]